MSELDRQFFEDRALRDAAREVFMADLAHAKTSLSGKSIAGRVTSRVGDGAKDVFEAAKVHGVDNRGVIAALLGAMILWFARGPIAEILGLQETDEADEDALGAAQEDTSTEHSEPLQDKPPISTPPLTGDCDD